MGYTSNWYVYIYISISIYLYLYINIYIYIYIYMCVCVFNLQMFIFRVLVHLILIFHVRHRHQFPLTQPYKIELSRLQMDLHMASCRTFIRHRVWGKGMPSDQHYPMYWCVIKYIPFRWSNLQENIPLDVIPPASLGYKRHSWLSRERDRMTIYFIALDGSATAGQVH